MTGDMGKVMKDIATETPMKVSLQEAKLMVLACITGRMGRSIKVTGSMAKRTDKDHGQVSLFPFY